MGTFFNGANCDIYVGKGAGKKLLDDISNAKNNIKIISPYLSPFLIKELIYLYSKGIEIHLITTDGIEDFYNANEKNIHKLIIQHQIKDNAAELVRNKWIDIMKILLYGIICLSLILLLSGYFYREIKLLYGCIPLLLLFLIRNFFQNKVKNKKIFNYHYTQLFPFKVFVSPKNINSYKNMFIHSKIYIIDDEIVYMGSLNFTSSGTKENYETRIRTIDKAAVNKIVEEFNDLFFNSGLPEIEIQSWGKSLYKEPIN
ncbi:phospholipase D-like domain-containing protein [Chishuiella sp.]|uniref:phospholipase D-like domain-containing protein n=1 Tax=Chishuiella sp. TaxID=1969467 RepID=UPI0028B0B9EA|nr:phospholipase D-like domain-containing protein [Chishuiella sp.]